MSSRKITLFYALLIAVASLAVGMVLASRLDLSPQSSAQTMAAPAMNSAPLSGPIDATTFRNIAKNATPFVVNIRTRAKRKAQDMSDFFGGDDPFRQFFGLPQGPGGRGNQRPRDQVVEAAGTGFIINAKEGLIVTNNHVVEGATDIFVAFGENQLDQEEYHAKLVGRDQLSDSALIQLVEKPAKPLLEAKFGDSSQMQPGDWVMAIGNPFGLAHTVTVGVISATKRPFTVAEQRSQDVLQTDAAINPGQLGRPAAQRPRRGDRHQHGDPREQPVGGQHRDWLRHPGQPRDRFAAAAADGQGHSRAHWRQRAGRASRERYGPRAEAAHGRARRNRHQGQPGR